MEAELKNESDNYIQIRKDENTIRFGIKDDEGNDTGNFLEFNLTRIDLLEKYQRLLDEDKKNRADVRNKLIILDKKQDHKGKKLLSYKEEEELKIYREFYKKEIEVYNLFLGENGVQKILNGRELTWFTLKEIDDIIEKVIYPKLQINAKNIRKEITEKYSNNFKKDDVIE